MSFNEVIYQEPNYEEPRTRLVFDPEIIPIRSCLRPEDDLQSCYGPVQKKSVAFSDYFTIITFGSCDELYVDMSGYQNLSCSADMMHLAMPRNDIHTYHNYPPEFNASGIWEYQNRFASPPSTRGLQSENPMQLQTNETTICTTTKSILKREGAPVRKGNLVRFALMQKNFANDGTQTNSFVTFDPLPECWRGDCCFKMETYWLNCNLL